MGSIVVLVNIERSLHRLSLAFKNNICKDSLTHLSAFIPQNVKTTSLKYFEKIEVFFVAMPQKKHF